MIKVQPARSRVVKTESSEKITLTMPREGLIGVGAALIVLSLLWLAGSGAFFVRAASIEWRVAASAFGLPGLFVLVAGIASYRATWTLDRTPDSLLFTKTNAWGTRRRRWDATAVTKLWAEETTPPGGLTTHHYSYRCYLMVGFRNGRSEEIMSGKDGEELRWLAAMLMDPRGSRRTAEQPEQAAEPVRKRYDDSVVPSTLTCSKLDSGVELRLQPVIENRRTWFGIFGIPMIGFLSALVAYGVVYGIFHQSTMLKIADGVFPGLMLAAILLLAYRVWIHTRAAEIDVQGGMLRIRQNHGNGSYEVKVEDVEFIQTFEKGGNAELQFLVRGQPKIRILDGRPSAELEWVARFLRVALKGRSEPESTPLRMDATAGDCQVCGERMQDRVVYCAKCRTPHHEECWSYVGTCSTYGCREIRFTRS